MSKTDWKLYQGVTVSPEGEKSLAAPHDEIAAMLGEDDKFCPPWRNFRQRHKAFQKQHNAPDAPLPAAPAEPDERGESFRPTPDMVEMVNVAIYLRRPLLITGKPGTGKSSLIYAVARELKLGKVLRWPITSRSSLQRGLYEYDAIGRLQDWQLKDLRMKQPGGGAQPKAKNDPPANNEKDAADIGEYLRLGPLGTALLPWERPRALLIDEIDKCDADLPNDLLNVFEEGQFEIPELIRLRKSQREVEIRPVDSDNPVKIIEGRVQCLHFPFVVMTSNGEREFPPAFLRRCVQLEIPEPEKNELWEIVKSHLGEAIEKEAEPIIGTFLDRIKKEKKQLATDQLLSAIFLLTREATPNDKQGRQKLMDSILKPLNK